MARSVLTATSPPLAARPQIPQAYTPPHLAEKILRSRTALKGERKQVTVLFADLKGSMELLADGDPEEARQLLDPVLERVMDAAHRYEGTAAIQRALVANGRAPSTQLADAGDIAAGRLV